MNNKLYIIGAGFNRNIEFDEEAVQIPVADDFFTSFVRKKSLGKYLKRFNDVFDYINKYWNIKLSEIEKGKKINLEELLSELEFKQAFFKQSDYFYRVKRKIEEMIFYLFSSYEFTSYHHSAQEILRFAKMFLNEKDSDIITFNYDNILERAIEIESGSNKLSEKEKNLMYEMFPNEEKNPQKESELFYKSQYKFNRVLSYPIKFDGISKELFITNDFHSHFFDTSYYDQEKQYITKQILKLHGSIGWFYVREPNDLISKLKVSHLKIFNENDFIYTTFNNIHTDDFDSNNKYLRDPFEYFEYTLDPLIITPTIFKNYRDKHIKKLWIDAQEKIKKADEIIIIGYSFPQTDFYSKIIFRENLKENVKIMIINPDEKIEQHIINDVLYKRRVDIIRFNFLKEYLDSKNVPYETVHLVVFEEDKRILDYAIGLTYFDGKKLRAKNISLGGINVKLNVVKYNKKIPQDFKRESNFYYIDGKIIKKP